MNNSDNNSCSYPKHGALTKYIRRGGVFSVRKLARILENCDVSPDVGALPPALRNIVPDTDVRHVTDKFRAVITDLLVNNKDALQSDNNCVHYELTAVSEIFNTPCFLTCNNSSADGNVPWRGLSGVVYKLSFPEINAEYALKDFKILRSGISGHGYSYEIPTAFAAGRAEPRQNGRVYMASFGAAKYMLSQWMGDKSDDVLPCRNTYEIFTSHSSEIAASNYRDGRRIDFGKTYLTAYGAAPYRVRKNYRKIVNVLSRATPELIVPDELVQLLGADMRAPQRREMEYALELVKGSCPMYMLRLLMKYEGRGRI